MRYGSISINKGLKELQDIGVNEVIVLPLYPHYAMSSYETVVEKVKDEAKNNFPDFNLKFISPFYKEKNFINLLSKKIQKVINKVDYDHILFSYHGIPVSHLKISDPTKIIATRLMIVVKYILKHMSFVINIRCLKQRRP